jgi:hypothetical protein
VRLQITEEAHTISVERRLKRRVTRLGLHKLRKPFSGRHSPAVRAEYEKIMDNNH